MQARVPRTLFLALAATTLTSEALAAAPRYAMRLDGSNAEHGVKIVSLVENPAIQRGWVALSEAVTTGTAPRRFHLSAATEGAQRQVITGPALLPGQEILRLDKDGNPYYITFDEPTIEGTARLFAAQGHHNNTNQDHAVKLAGNVVYESWIVANPANDKAAELGLDVPQGTWMLSVHIPDADYWQNEVVSGNKTGFSIEGLFDTQQLNLSAVKPAPTPMPATQLYSGILAKLSKMAPEKAAEMRLALGMEQLQDGRGVMIDDTTGAVTLCESGQALPDGTYTLANGGELVVQAGLRKDGETQPTTPGADANLGNQPAPKTDGAPAAEAMPAPLADNAGLPDVVKALNELIKSAGGKEGPKENPATAPAAPKMGTALHGVALAAIGEKLGQLKLDAIDLTGGDKLTYNAVTRQLRDSKGALVESGYYAAADGSYFSVDTDQYIWEISKTTYDAVYAKLSAETRVRELEAKLATTPAGGKVRLGGESGQAVEHDLTTVKGRAAARLARVELTR